MGDKDPAQLPTPSMDRSISSDSKVSGDTKTSSTSKYTLSTTPHTPKKQKTCASQDNISYRMALRGLKQGGTAFDAAEEFKQYIRRIVLSERSSAMKDSTAKKFTETLKFYEGSNKATFLYHMIPILQGEGYHVSPEKKQRMDKETQEWKTFLTDEKVKVILNQEFG